MGELDSKAVHRIIKQAGDATSDWCHALFVVGSDFAATGDAFCLHGNMALQGVRNCVKVVDNILLYDENFSASTKCSPGAGITLNKEMFVVTRPTVHTPSQVMASQLIQVKSTPSRTPTPANLTDLCSFMGLVNHLAEFTPNSVTAAQPLCPLLTPKRVFMWPSIIPRQPSSVHPFLHLLPCLLFSKLILLVLTTLVMPSYRTMASWLPFPC